MLKGTVAVANSTQISKHITMMKNALSLRKWIVASMFVSVLSSVNYTILAQDHVRIVHSTDVAPGGGTFSDLRSVVVEQTGSVVFYNYPDGLFRWANGALSVIVDHNTAAPTGGTFTRIYDYAVSGTGEIAFQAATSTVTDQNIYLKTSAGIFPIAIVGQSAPSGGVFNGAFTGFSVARPGIVAFGARTAGGAGGGVYLGTPSGVTTVAAIGDLAPDGGFFSNFTSLASAPGVDSSSQVAFEASAGSGGVFLKTATGIILLASGAGNGYGNLMLNEAGQASFVTSGGTSIFFGSTPNLTAVLSQGSPLDSGQTGFQYFIPVVGSNGTMVFTAFDQAGKTALFWRNPSGKITRLAQSGSPSPGGGLFSSNFSIPMVNSYGQLSFVGVVSGGTRLFYWDGSILSKIIGAGDSLSGVTIQSVSQHESLAVPVASTEQRAASDASKIVYVVQFTNGVRGVYLYTLPSVSMTDFRIFSGTPRISFASVIGKTYVVERKNLLSDPNWTTVTGAGAVAGTGSIVQISDPDPGAGTTSSRYYRVRVIP